MTKGLLLAGISVAIVAASAATASPYDAAVEALNPVAYFNMANSDGSTITSLNNAYTLALNNGADVVAGTGPTINGSAVPALQLANGAGGQQFAGEGGNKPLAGQVGTAGTLVGWINLAALPSTQGRIFSLFGESASGDDLDLQIDPSDNSLRFYTNGGGYVAGASDLTSADVGQWVFVAASFTSNGTADVYINGGNPASGGAGGHTPTNAPFYIGQSNVFGGRYFDGGIADVALFGTQLTTDQIDGLYAEADAPVTAAVPEPVTWAMMIGGFGLAGAALRRKRHQPEGRPARSVRLLTNA